MFTSISFFRPALPTEQFSLRILQLGLMQLDTLQIKKNWNLYQEYKIWWKNYSVLEIQQ
jgi:hypothetical protein